MEHLKSVCILFAIFLGGCSAKSDLKITNETDELISDLQVEAGGDDWQLGDLKPGQSVDFREALAGEGGPQISWVWNTKRYTDQGCYYTAPHIASEGSLAITGADLKVLECR